MKFNSLNCFNFIFSLLGLNDRHSYRKSDKQKKGHLKNKLFKIKILDSRKISLILNFLIGVFILHTNLLGQSNFSKGILVGCANLKTTNEMRSTVSNKGDIPEFCERELVPITLKPFKGMKLTSQGSKHNQPTPSSSSTTINNNDNYSIYYYEFIFNIFLIFLILYLLSYLKWFEQMYLIIYDYIHRAYCNFLDLTYFDSEGKVYFNKRQSNIQSSANTIAIGYENNQEMTQGGLLNLENHIYLEKNSDVPEDIVPFSKDSIKFLEEKFVYIFGKTLNNVSAYDVLFNFPAYENKTKFLRIERKVEIYDPKTKTWEPLILRGLNNVYNFNTFNNNYNSFNNNYFSENKKQILQFSRNYSISLHNDDYLRIDYDDASYIYPLIICSNFTTKDASLRGIKLSPIHFNQLTNGQILDIKSEGKKISDIIDNFNNNINTKMKVNDFGNDFKFSMTKSSNYQQNPSENPQMDMNLNTAQKSLISPQGSGAGKGSGAQLLQGSDFSQNVQGGQNQKGFQVFKTYEIQEVEIEDDENIDFDDGKGDKNIYLKTEFDENGNLKNPMKFSSKGQDDSNTVIDKDNNVIVVHKTETKFIDPKDSNNNTYEINNKNNNILLDNKNTNTVIVNSGISNNQDVIGNARINKNNNIYLDTNTNIENNFINNNPNNNIQTVKKVNKVEFKSLGGNNVDIDNSDHLIEKLKKDQDLTGKFSYEFKDEYIYITPIINANNYSKNPYNKFDDEEENLNNQNETKMNNNPLDSSKMRISFYGYEGKDLCVMAQVMDGKFRTVRTPYIDQYYRNALKNNPLLADEQQDIIKTGIKDDSFMDLKTQNQRNNDLNEQDKTQSTVTVNQSANMVVYTNTDNSFFNFFFCCCFNPVPVYIFNRTETFKTFSYGSINWINEGKTSKEEFLYKKHRVSLFRLWLNRIIVFLLVFLIFLIFPSFIFFLIAVFTSLFKSTIAPNKGIDFTFIIIDLILTSILVIGVILYTKMKDKGRLICFIITFILALLFLILLILFFLKNKNIVKFSSSSHTSSTSSN